MYRGLRTKGLLQFIYLLLDCAQTVGVHVPLLQVLRNLPLRVPLGHLPYDGFLYLVHGSNISGLFWTHLWNIVNQAGLTR